MTLQNHFVASGNWLFRRRSWLPLVPLALVAIGIPGYEYPGGSRSLHRWWGLGCLAVGLVGVAVRVLTVGYIAGTTSGRNRGGQVAESLNTRGVYSVVRHPLYLGNYFMWLGAAMVPRNPWIVIIVSFVFWLYYERIMAAEEAFLREKFGVAYDDWAARTPAFLPALRLWRPAARPFSPRMVLRREHSGVFGLVVAVCVLAQAADAAALGALRVDPLWAWLLGVTTAATAAVVALKRYTGVLRVTDR